MTRILLRIVKIRFINRTWRKPMPMLWLLAFALAGCAGGQPAPDPDGPLLTGFEALPKQLATIALSPTLDAAQIEATRASQYTPTPAIPPTFTPTATPLVGVFMGNLTPLPGTIVFRPRSGPTGPAVIVTLPVGMPLVQPPFAQTPGQPVQPMPIPTAIAGSPLNCAIQPGGPLGRAAADPSVQSRLGCPNGEAQSVTMVIQPFQNGLMLWRDSREIYALAAQASGQPGVFWRFPDNWNESLPASDPALVPPENLLQPVRGFGFVWRSSPPVRERLGWATAPEQPYMATFQPFERGWMLTGPDGSIFAFAPNDSNPTAIGIYFGPFTP